MSSFQNPASPPNGELHIMFPPETDFPAERHFIEMATRPLEAQPEVRDEARGELMERLSRQDPVKRQAAAEAAVARLAKEEPQGWAPKATSIAIAWVLLVAAASYFSYLFYQQGEDFSRRWDAAIDTAYRRDDPDTGVLGPLPELSPAARYEAELSSGAIHFPNLPADYRATWMKLDEGNGAWSWREALHTAEQEMHKAGSTTLVNFGPAWQLFEEAARAPRFDLHEPERFLALRLACGKPQDGLELMIQNTGGFPLWFGGPDTRRVILKELLRAKSQSLADTHDLDGLRRLIRDWETLCVRLAKEARSADDLKPAADLIAAGEPLRGTAASLGMTAERERLHRQIGQMELMDPKLFLPSPHGAASMMTRQIYSREEAIPEADFTPGRMIEFHLAERVLAMMAGLPVMLALALVLIESVRRGRRVNGLASGLGPLFDGRDGLWLIGLGVVAPFAWYWAITRLTPLGGRAVGIGDGGVPPILFQAPAGLLLLLTMIVQTGQWRIALRGSVIGLGPRKLWPGFLAAGVAAAMVPIGGIGRFIGFGQVQQFLLMGSAACGIPLLWLLWRGGALIFGPGSNALGGVLLARATALPLALSAAALLIAYPLLHSQEKSWLAQDRLTGWDTRHGTTLLEARSVEAYLAKCRELFSPPERP